MYSSYITFLSAGSFVTISYISLVYLITDDRNALSVIKMTVGGHKYISLSPTVSYFLIRKAMNQPHSTHTTHYWLKEINTMK